MVVCACLLAAASCGGDDDGGDDGADREPPTTTAPVTSTTLTQEEQDEEALRQLAEDWFDVSRAIFGGDATVEEAGQYLIDPYLTAFQMNLSTALADGRTVRLGDDSANTVEAVEVMGDSAVVHQCVVDADVLVNRDGTVDDDRLVAFFYESEAVRADGEWKFADRRTIRSVEGADECDQ